MEVRADVADRALAWIEEEPAALVTAAAAAGLVAVVADREEAETRDVRAEADRRAKTRDAMPTGRGSAEGKATI